MATGVFTWIINRYPVSIGQIAGCIAHDGYRIIKVDGNQYPAHRLAWLYVNGRWPTGMLDHTNGDKLDNRIGNLREATSQQNNWNKKMKATNTSGFIGVTVRTNTYQAKIKKDGESIFIGSFKTPEDAHEAYKAKSIELFGEFSIFFKEAK